MDRKDELFAEVMATIYVIVWGVIQYLLSKVTYSNSTVGFLNCVSWLFLLAAACIGLTVTIHKIRKKRKSQRRA